MAGNAKARVYRRFLHVMQATTKGLGYVALGIIFAAPLLSAFRVNAAAVQRRRFAAAAPSHAMTITVNQGQVQAQVPV